MFHCNYYGIPSFFNPMEIPFQFILNQEIILHAKLWHNARENKMSSVGISAEGTENTGASGQRTENTQSRENQAVTAAHKIGAHMYNWQAVFCRAQWRKWKPHRQYNR